MVRRVGLDKPARRERSVSEALEGVRALSEPLELAESEAIRVCEALRVLPDRPGLAVLLVNPEAWALLVKQVSPEVMASLEHKVRLDLPDLPAPRVARGSRALRAQWVSLCR